MEQAAHRIAQVLGHGGQQVARALALPPSRWEEERRWLFGQVKEEERRGEERRRVTCADISYRSSFLRSRERE